MTLIISLDRKTIDTLNLEQLQSTLTSLLHQGSIAQHEQQLQFQIDYPLEPGDPRELPEIPEVRLWFIRLDSLYPWLPFLLDWKAGELARYAAMLVPHQFNPGEGILYNPEALEIFVMQKIFVLMDWMRQQGLESRSRLKSMAQMLGYELEDEFFQAIGNC